jgi:predicted nucleic acid-binding protein
MSIWSSEIARAWRRLKPTARRGPLARRAEELLPQLTPDLPIRLPLLYDTTVYIDQLQGRLAAELSDALELAETWHGAVALAELAHAATRVDPARPDHRAVVGAVLETIEDAPSHRVLTPTPSQWRNVGLLDGLLARLEGRDRDDRRRTLNDALMLLLARDNGLTLLTRNLRDMDLLQQLVPQAKVLFYRC